MNQDSYTTVPKNAKPHQDSPTWGGPQTPSKKLNHEKQVKPEGTPSRE